MVGGPWLQKVFGLNSGFEWWDDDGTGSFNGRVAADLNARAVPWLEKVTEPFFFFLNYFDAHGPLMPPPEFADLFLPAPLVSGAPLSPEQTLALYDGEIRYADEHLGEVIAALNGAISTTAPGSSSRPTMAICLASTASSATAPRLTRRCCTFPS